MSPIPWVVDDAEVLTTKCGVWKRLPSSGPMVPPPPAYRRCCGPSSRCSRLLAPESGFARQRSAAARFAPRPSLNAGLRRQQSSAVRGKEGSDALIAPLPIVAASGSRNDVPGPSPGRPQPFGLMGAVCLRRRTALRFAAGPGHKRPRHLRETMPGPIYVIAGRGGGPVPAHMAKFSVGIRVDRTRSCREAVLPGRSVRASHVAGRATAGDPRH